MAIEQLTFTPQDKGTSNERNQTMVLMVDEEMLQKYKKDQSIPLAEVVDSFDIFQFDEGKSGRLGQPSKQEIKAIFGTTNDDEIVKFMLENGRLHGKAVY